MNILDAVWNTSLVQLRRAVPTRCADIYVKLEWENPTGSVKDRMALAVISAAEGDGRLNPGGTVVEYTGGNTGASLALVCAAKGYRLRIVTSDAFSREKLDQMRAFGAELTLVPSEGGKTTKKLILDMIGKARELSREPKRSTTRPCESRAWSPASRRCSRAGSRVRTRSKAWESATRRHCGNRRLEQLVDDSQGRGDASLIRVCPGIIRRERQRRRRCN